MVACSLLPWMTSATGGLVLAHTLFVLFGRAVGGVSDQVQGARYSESKVEMDRAALELEMNTTASGQIVSQEISKQERYATD
jgi:hypothetical protein